MSCGDNDVVLHSFIPDSEILRLVAEQRHGNLPIFRDHLETISKEKGIFIPAIRSCFISYNFFSTTSEKSASSLTLSIKGDPYQTVKNHN